MKHEIFKTNPNLKEVHITSDGECFYNEGDAKNHSKSLEDKKVELVLNPDHITVEGAEEVEAEEVTEEAAEEVAEEAVEEAAEEVAEEAVEEVAKEAAEEALEVDLSKMNKSQLIEFAKLNGLTIVPEWTNKVMVEELFKQIEGKK